MREADANNSKAIASTNANTGETNRAAANEARSAGSSSQRDHTKSSTHPPTSDPGNSAVSDERVWWAGESTFDMYDPSVTVTQSIAKTASSRYAKGRENTETANEALTTVRTKTKSAARTARDTVGRGVHQRSNGRTTAGEGGASGRSTLASLMGRLGGMGGDERDETVGVERLLLEQ